MTDMLSCQGQQHFRLGSGHVWQDNDNRLYDNDLFVVLGMIIFFNYSFVLFLLSRMATF